MKKSLLSLAAVMAVSGAFAVNPSKSLSFSGQLTERKGMPARKLTSNLKASELMRTPGSPLQKRLTRADEATQLSMNWGYCDSPYLAMPSNAGEFGGAIQLSAEKATTWAGATISAVTVCTPLDFDSEREEDGWYVYDNPVKKVTVWVKEALDGEPVVSTTADLDSEGVIFQEIPLDQPYTLKAETPVYIGYTFQDVPEDGNYGIFITDYNYPLDSMSCYVWSKYSGYDDWGYPVFEAEDYDWSELGYDYGNLCMKARVNGDMLPTNVTSVYAYQLPVYAAPGEPFEALIQYSNAGANTIETIDLTLEVEGMEPQVKTLDVAYAPLAYGEYSLDGAEFECTTVGNNIAYKFYISAVNGEKIADDDLDIIEGTLLCISEGYAKNTVFEEYTGTWCGWCVVGYAGMEYMAENYADKGFIGIAVHSGDEMEVCDVDQPYYEISQVVTGFPCAYANRDMSTEIYPDPEDLEYYFEMLSEVPAYAEISATVENGSAQNTLKLSTKTKFGASEEDADYRVGYVVIENGVGPYVQHNYAAGLDDDYYGFEDKGELVPLKFNEVARECSEPAGVAESLPASIEEGVEYPFEVEIPLTGVADAKKVRVVALVVNNINGTIENACEVEVPGYNGVKGVLGESAEPLMAYGLKGGVALRANNGKASVYSIDGRCVAREVKGSFLALPAGMYVVTLNGKSVKVAVR